MERKHEDPNTTWYGAGLRRHDDLVGAARPKQRLLLVGQFVQRLRLLRRVRQIELRPALHGGLFQLCLAVLQLRVVL